MLTGPEVAETTESGRTPEKHGGGNQSTANYAWCLIMMLDNVHEKVAKAPPEMDIPRETIQGLLMAAYHLLGTDPALDDPYTENDYLLKQVVRELAEALMPLG